jgi:hypothetical protein
VAVAFSIDYTVRLYNRADGKTIFKSSSIGSTNVDNYGKSISATSRHIDNRQKTGYFGNPKWELKN